MLRLLKSVRRGWPESLGLIEHFSPSSTGLAGGTTWLKFLKDYTGYPVNGKDVTVENKEKKQEGSCCYNMDKMLYYMFNILLDIKRKIVWKGHLNPKEYDFLKNLMAMLLH